MLLGRLATQYWDGQPDGQLDVVDGCSAWDDVGLLALDQVFDLPQSLRTVDEHLSQRKVMRKSVDVVRHYNVQTTLRAVDLTNLKDLHIIAEHIAGHLEGRDIDHLNVWIFQAEDSTELGVLTLQELLHGDPLEFLNRY